MSQEPVQKQSSRWMTLVARKIITENPLTKTIELVHKDQPDISFDYKSGQYITCRFDTLAPKPVVRSYSLSSAPGEKGFLAITVKKILNGLVSTYLCDTLKEGDEIKARGPMGRFCFDFAENQDHLMMIAAGSGVTPFLSLLKQNQKVTHREASLLVSYPSKDMAIGLNLLEQLSLEPYHHISICLTQKTATPNKKENIYSGRITKSMLDQVCDHRYKNKSFMICGPDAFMADVESWLLASDVCKENIQKESF